MFKGKISFYKNVDGKEERIEEEFDDPRLYREFIAKHPELRYPTFEMPVLWSVWNPLTFGGLWDSLDDIVDRRLRLWADDTEGTSTKMLALPEWVRMDEYEKEIQRIEAEKANREVSRKSLEEASHKLKGYIARFKESGSLEKAKQAQEDLKKVEEKLKQM